MNDGNERYIPTADEVAGGGGNTWRIASGKILRGSFEKGTLEEKDRVVGELLRVGTYEGISSFTGKPYGQLECEIKQNGGEVIRLKVATTDKVGNPHPSICLLTFAGGLALAEKGEILKIEPRLGKLNAYDKKPTYANVYSIEPREDGSFKTTELRDEERIEGATMSDRWDSLLARLEQTSAWEVRTNDDEGGDRGETYGPGYQAAIAAIRAKGWPLPYGQAEEAWADSLKLLFRLPKAKRLSEYTDADWQKVAELVPLAKTTPPPIKKYQDDLKTAQADEYDPFADE